MAEKENQSFIEQEATTILSTEIRAWETSSVFITDRVSFMMRNLIRQLRKNYWGVFNNPIDPVSGRKRIWVPLTESAVEATVKNIDLDSKDINIRATNEKAIPLARVLRAKILCVLDEIGFGELLDKSERILAIDGSIVWKTWREWDEDEKRFKIKVRIVDLLNLYSDPTAECLRDTPVIERAIITKQAFEGMDDLINKDQVSFQRNVNRWDNETNFKNVNMTGEVEYVEMWERWGKAPKALITGNPNDKKQVDTRILASSKSGGYVIHKIEELSKDNKTPYEDGWLTRIAGRWQGKGVAEKLMMLQVWINTIINIRVTRSYVSQLGIFKIKKGSGITPQMLKRLAPNGAIPVNDMDDLEQLVMEEASASSYTDEANIQGWAKQVTSTYETVTGERLPSSTPATNAAIQAQAGQSQFTLYKEGLGMFLERWIKNQLIPLIIKDLKPKDIIQVTGDYNDVKELDEMIVYTEAYKQLSDGLANGKLFDIEQVENQLQGKMEQLKKMGGDRFITLLQKLDPAHYGVQVDITNESFDKGVLSKNLIDALSIAPEYRDQILGYLFDMMGLPFNPKQKTDTAGMQQGLPQGQQQPSGSANPLAPVTAAKTLQNIR